MVPGVTAKAPWHSVGRAVCAGTARMLLWNGAGVRRLARSRRWIRSGTESDTGEADPCPCSLLLFHYHGSAVRNSW